YATPSLSLSTNNRSLARSIHTLHTTGYEPNGTLTQPAAAAQLAAAAVAAAAARPPQPSPCSAAQPPPSPPLRTAVRPPPRNRRAAARHHHRRAQRRQRRAAAPQHHRCAPGSHRRAQHGTTIVASAAIRRAATRTFSALHAKRSKRLHERPSRQHRPATAPLTVTRGTWLGRQETRPLFPEKTGGQRRADTDTFDPNALDVLERLERVGIQGCYNKKPIVTSASDPPASKSITPRQDGGSSKKDDTRSGHLQQTAGSASASDYPSRSKAKLQSEQTGKRQKGKGVTGDANPPDDNAVIRCRLSLSANLDPDLHGDTEGAEQDTQQDNDNHHRRRPHQRRRAHTSRRDSPSNSNDSDETDSEEDRRRHCRRRRREQRRRRSPSSSSDSSSLADPRYH
ncbi:MAG: hypothetical protein BJ554DRAFT_4404, partial [Olpidium bornovanus]